MLIMGMITAAMTAAYMTRVMYLTFFGEFRGGHHDEHADADHGHDDAHAHHGDPHESGPRILWPLRILAGLAVVAGLMNLPKGFLGLGSNITLQFEHYVEPLSATKYFPKISHADPSWSLAIFSTLVVALAVGAAYWYYFVKVNGQSPSATEMVNGPTERNGLLKAGHTMLKNKYYLDHIYDGGPPVGAAGATAMGSIFGAAAGLTLGFSLDNGLDQPFWPSLIWGVVLGLGVFTIVTLALRTGVGVASFVKRPLAYAANWTHENIIDGAVDEGRQEFGQGGRRCLQVHRSGCHRRFRQCHRTRFARRRWRIAPLVNRSSSTVRNRHVRRRNPACGPAYHRHLRV